MKVMQDRVYDVLHKHTSTQAHKRWAVRWWLCDLWKAIKTVFGGLMVSLIRSNGTADQAPALINGMLYG